MTGKQKIAVFQQQGSAEKKIQGILRHGENLFEVEVISIDEALPALIEDSSLYLPSHLDVSLVLDYLKHPDLSEDLALLCSRLGIPVVASGKKLNVEGVLTPPT